MSLVDQRCAFLHGLGSCHHRREESSYSTAMRARASSATCTFVAATAARVWPLYRTSSAARTLWLIKRRLFIVPSEMSVILPWCRTRSAEVTTAYTLGPASARRGAIALI